MSIDEVKARVKEIFAIGGQRHAEQGRTGSVNLNEILTPEEASELSKLLNQLPSKKPSNTNNLLFRGDTLLKCEPIQSFINYFRPLILCSLSFSINHQIQLINLYQLRSKNGHFGLMASLLQFQLKLKN